MALSQAESTGPRRPNSFIGENYQFTLNESIQSLLAEIRDGTSNFSRFADVFYHLMQAKIDSSFESIWFYAALSFRSHKSANEDPLRRVSVAKDLFQLISACSGPCSSSKSIGLLAPVVFEVYTLVIELLAKSLDSKREKKALKGITSLIDVILGYISVCSSKNLKEESDELDLSLSMPISDLVRVWIDPDNGLGSFLPLVSGEVCRKMAEGDCDVNYLAGAVVLEAFLLKLSLDMRDGVMGTDKEKNLKNWVVASITGFRNVYFFEILVNMLLEAMFPETSLLNSKDRIFLRKIIYDAVIAVDYSFLSRNTPTNLPTERMRALAVTRLIVTHEAIEFCRENEDQERAIFYSNAFSASQLHSQIIKWIKMGVDGGANTINGSSPKSLIKVLLNLENQGIRVFEDSLLKRRAKLAIENSRGDYEQLASNIEDKKVDADLLFYINDKGEEVSEEEEVEDDGVDDEGKDEMTNAAFVNAARSMNLSENGGKKRKERGKGGKKTSVKYFKYDVAVPDSAKKNVASAASNDDSSSGSEMEDLQSD